LTNGTGTRRGAAAAFGCRFNRWTQYSELNAQLQEMMDAGDVDQEIFIDIEI